MKKLVLLAVAVVLAVQVVPYGRNHQNPPVEQEPSWDTAVTRELVRRACFDCHSNQTTWPWYSSVAPVSWLVQHDVEEGRSVLNFSEWSRPQREAKKMVEEVEGGEMPPKTYTPAHPEARLTPSEREALIRGLQAILAARSDVAK